MMVEKQPTNTRPPAAGQSVKLTPTGFRWSFFRPAW